MRSRHGRLSWILWLALAACTHRTQSAPTPPWAPYEGPPRRLVEGCWKASFAPDGQRLVCGRWPELSGIDIVDLGTAKRTPLVSFGKDPVWSPDGQWVAFVQTSRETDYDGEELFIVPAQGGTPRRLGQGGFPSFVTTRDGVRLLFHRRPPARTVVALDPERSDAPATTFIDRMSCYYPAFSRDGERVVVSQPGLVWVAHPGAADRPLFKWAHGERGVLAALSPDARLLAYGGFNDRRSGLSVVDLSTARGLTLIPGPYTMPAWSPDGRLLAFDLRDRSRREVWIVGAAFVRGQLSEEGRPGAPYQVGEAYEVDSSTLKPLVKPPRTEATSP